MIKNILGGRKKLIIKSSSKNIPTISTIKEVYAKLPSDKKTPIVFESKEQYLNEYVKNQEKEKGKFPKKQILQYKQRELKDMGNIVSRYTTNHNPYIDKRTVFFTDRKWTPNEFRKSAEHEYGHELWEKNKAIRSDWKSVSKSTSPTAYGRTDKQEDFAESYMLMREGKLDDPRRAMIINKDTRSQADIVMLPTGQDLFSQNRQLTLQGARARKLIAQMQAGRPEAFEEQNKLQGMDEYFRKKKIDNDDSPNKKFLFSKDTIHEHFFEVEAPNKKSALTKLGADPWRYDKIDYPDTLSGDFRSENSINLKDTRKFKFGTVDWQNAVEHNINQKMAHNEALGGMEKSYIDTQSEIHPKKDIDIRFKHISKDSSKDSISEAIDGTSLPEETLMGNEWKLYGFHKTYNPAIEHHDLKTNIMGIAVRHYNRLNNMPGRDIISTNQDDKPPNPPSSLLLQDNLLIRTEPGRDIVSYNMDDPRPGVYGYATGSPNISSLTNPDMIITGHYANKPKKVLITDIYSPNLSWQDVGTAIGKGAAKLSPSNIKRVYEGRQAQKAVIDVSGTAVKGGQALKKGLVYVAQKTGIQQGLRKLGQATGTTALAKGFQAERAKQLAYEQKEKTDPRLLTAQKIEASKPKLEILPSGPAPTLPPMPQMTPITGPQYMAMQPENIISYNQGMNPLTMIGGSNIMPGRQYLPQPSPYLTRDIGRLNI